MNIDKQFGVIKRGTVEIISEAELKKKLEKSLKDKKPLVVKAGFDPTAPDIHLGHTVLLRKLRHFQNLGHKVVFLIGDATGLVGDPSGQSQTRKNLSRKEVQINAKTYEGQIGKILDTKSRAFFERRHNSEWFLSGSQPFAFEQFAQVASRYTIARLLERDDFQKRLKENRPISFLELFYPLMQGYDSVQIKSDIEIGGTDQKFNMLVGRDLQESYGQQPQVVITMPLLEGLDGTQKMSKSLNNYIGITEPADEIFGKIMSIPDSLMYRYYELLTDEDLVKVKSLHPKEAKLRLAENICAQYYSRKDASVVRSEFERVFSKKELPADMPKYKTDGEKTILSILSESGLIKSGNEGRRLLKQGAVCFNNARIDKEGFTPGTNGILKVGSRRFLEIIV